MEMKCFPSNPDKAEIDILRLTHPYFMNVSAPMRTAGWFKSRKLDESILMVLADEELCAAFCDE